MSIQLSAASPKLRLPSEAAMPPQLRVPHRRRWECRAPAAEGPESPPVSTIYEVQAKLQGPSGFTENETLQRQLSSGCHNMFKGAGRCDMQESGTGFHFAAASGECLPINGMPKSPYSWIDFRHAWPPGWNGYSGSCTAKSVLDSTRRYLHWFWCFTCGWMDASMLSNACIVHRDWICCDAVQRSHCSRMSGWALSDTHGLTEAWCYLPAGSQVMWLTPALVRLTAWAHKDYCHRSPLGLLVRGCWLLRETQTTARLAVTTAGKEEPVLYSPP